MRIWILLSALLILVATANIAHAAGDAKHPTQQSWPFDGVTGTVDRQAAQRGFQVYKEVCSACHGIKQVAFRTLQDLGFSENEIKALAAGYTFEEINDEGDVVERAGKPSDKFPSPFANEKAARSANGGAYPPDLSLMVKARPDGANYLHALLTGYKEPPADLEMSDGMYYNPYFPGGQIAMPPQLSDDLVTYADGTSATADQMAKDLVVFLQWTAEPEMEERKRMGIKVMLFLLIMTVLFYFAMKRTWRNVKH